MIVLTIHLFSVQDALCMFKLVGSIMSSSLFEPLIGGIWGTIEPFLTRQRAAVGCDNVLQKLYCQTLHFHEYLFVI